MGVARHARTPRKLAVSALVAVALTVILTAAVSAGSRIAIWSGEGDVLFAGPSLDPSTPTTTESEFEFGRDGSIRSVKINTTNEFVMGLLGEGGVGDALISCRERKGSGACEDLDELLTGATVTSLHKSEARLRRIVQSIIQIPVPTPGGLVIFNVPTLSGQVRGELEGIFTLTHLTAAGPTGAATGKVRLRIGEGSTATYACFAPTPAGPVPLESLQPCIDDTGGQLFPVILDVKDKGVFEIGEGVGTMSGIVGLQGRVNVNAQANLLLGEFGGSIEIPRAKASVGG